MITESDMMEGMETIWLWAAAAVVLSVAAAAAGAIRTSLVILGEERLSEENAGGNRKAGLLLAAIRDPGLRYPFSLWAASAALKAASILLAGAAGVLLGQRVGGWPGAASAAAWAAAFLVFLFFLENVSSGAAMESPRRVLVLGGPSLAVLRIAVLPARAFDRIGRLLFGRHYSPEALMDIRFGSEEGILDVVEEGAEHGTIDPAEEKMIGGVLRFGEMTVSEGMTPWGDVVILREGMTRDEIAAVAGESGFSRYPVLSPGGEELVGVLSYRNLLRPQHGERWESLLEKPVYVPESLKVSDLLRRFQRTGMHMAVVIDEHGKLRGVITVHDLLERIVGRLAGDQEDDEGPEWEKDGALSVPASTPIRVLREEYGIDLPMSPFYETAGGFVTDRLQEIPERTVSFLADGYRITVVETGRRRILRLRIERSATGT